MLEAFATGDDRDIAQGRRLQIGARDGRDNVAVKPGDEIVRQSDRLEIVVEAEDDETTAVVRQCANMTGKVGAMNSVGKIEVALRLDRQCLSGIIDKFAQVLIVGHGNFYT
jgi:hypothetical protein